MVGTELTKKSQHFPIFPIFSVRTCVNEKEAIHERPNLRVSTFMTIRVTFHTSSQFYLRAWNLRGTHGKNYALVEIYLNGWLSVNSAFLLAIRACKMGISGPVARSGFRSCLVPHEKILSWPLNKSFIDQACVFKVAEYWARSFFYVFIQLLDKTGNNFLFGMSVIIAVSNTRSLWTLQQDSFNTSVVSLPRHLS